MRTSSHLDDYSWTFYIAVMVASIAFVGAVVYGVDAVNTVLQANTAAVEAEYVCGGGCQMSPLTAWAQFRALAVTIGGSFALVAGLRGCRIWRRNKTSDED